MSDVEEHGGARAPICSACGVTALPGEMQDRDDNDPGWVCENPDCEAFGDDV